MELKVDICTLESCKVTVEDLTVDYQPEDNNNSNYGKFRYSDTLSIDVLQLVTPDKLELQSPVFSSHSKKSCPVTLSIDFDGWFKIHHIILPTKEWFENELLKGELSILRLYDTVYYSDGENVFKYINKRRSKVSIEEIVERNVEKTTLSRYTLDYVSICFLRKCYIDLCQLIFNSNAFDKCSNKNKVDSELIFKRDMVWMAINVIKYMVEFNQLHEVSRLIDRLSSCNGLCRNTNTVRGTGCGCSKKYGM